MRLQPASQVQAECDAVLARVDAMFDSAIAQVEAMTATLRAPWSPPMPGGSRSTDRTA